MACVPMRDGLRDTLDFLNGKGAKVATDREITFNISLTGLKVSMDAYRDAVSAAFKAAETHTSKEAKPRHRSGDITLKFPMRPAHVRRFCLACLSVTVETPRAGIDTLDDLLDRYVGTPRERPEPRCDCGSRDLTTDPVAILTSLRYVEDDGRRTAIAGACFDARLFPFRRTGDFVADVLHGLGHVGRWRVGLACVQAGICEPGCVAGVNDTLADERLARMDVEHIRGGLPERSPPPSKCPTRSCGALVTHHGARAGGRTVCPSCHRTVGQR